MSEQEQNGVGSSADGNEQANNEQHPLHSCAAAKTALAAPSEQSLRTACFCEENVWRLAYRRIHGEDGVGGENGRSNLGSVGCSNGCLEVEYNVVFISNPGRCCPMYCQVAKEDPNEACVWDYHVVLLRSKSVDVDAHPGTSDLVREDPEKARTATFVVDMDSRLAYPCPVADYLEGTFPNFEYFRQKYGERYSPLFRVVSAELYLGNFYSDRMHMYDEATKQWHAPPPAYDCIMVGWDGSSVSKDVRRSNLDDYIDMTKTSVVDTEQSNRVEGEDAVSGRHGIMGEVLTLEEFRSRFVS